jgi:protein TonB
MNFETAVNEVVVETRPVEKPTEVKEEIFRSVEQMPQFPGGDAALLKFLSSHINYPPMAAENNVQGKVTVQFVVGKDGYVGEVKVVRSVDKELDREAIRVCKLLPKFTPGRQNGQPVSVWYTLPVQFKLQGTN